jgi:staphylococcal nuclease domain-containing protein 1
MQNEVEIVFKASKSSKQRKAPAKYQELQNAEKFANIIAPFPSAQIPPLGKKRIQQVTPAEYAKMAVQAAKVKYIESGDSVVLCALNDSTKERKLSLAFVQSPHFKKEGDDQFAFESREYLRKLLVGQHVQFKVLYEIPSTKRQYGVINLADGRKFPEEAVKDGWIKLREDAGRKEDTEESQRQLNELRLLEAQARIDDKGVWATSGGRIDTQHELSDPDSFLEQYKGKTLDALVERVLSGDRMIVRLVISPKEHVQVITLVAGIRAPATERLVGANKEAQPAEEYGNAAKQFVEDRLLQRNVKVDIFGLSPSKQLIAAVRHPRGSIAKFLLEEGLARCTDNHSTMLGADMAPLRAAEASAKAAKKNLFKAHVAKASASGSNLEVTVTKVFSADVIYVRNKAGVEKRINISSIRGPRQNESTEAPFRDDAKEYLRKKIIGKHVRVSIDGSRPAVSNADGQSYDAKDVATVLFNDKNIGLLLVQDGWASVIRHKRDDPDRAPNYDELLAAGEKAKEEKKGMWSGKPRSAKVYVDASETVQKAKMNLGTLQRQKKIPAIVDFVKGGSRFTILIPREGIKINFVLGGIRCPKSARSATDTSEPFGQEAHELANRRCSQRDVEIDVHNIDKVGGFIGELYINRESFAKILVDEGLATVHQYSAEQSGNATELIGAQDRAKAARKNLWAEWDPSQDAVEEDTAGLAGNDANGDAPVDRKPDYRDVVVTNITEEGKLLIQVVGSGTSALETMMSAFKKFHMTPANNVGLPGPPKTGDLVAAKFSEDGQWYRARVRSNDRANKKAEVLYIDYGNSEKQDWSKLRALSQAEFSTTKLKAQAQNAVLSLLQLPTNKQYLDDAVDCMTQLTAGKNLVANVDFTDRDGTLYVTLYDGKADPTKGDSINAEIVAEGLAMVPRKLKAWERSFGDVLKVLKQKGVW